MLDLDSTARADVVRTLREAGARFAYVFGSRARGDHTVASDLDVAAWFGTNAPQSFDVILPSEIDLLVLDHAPLELRGRVALEGVLLFDDAPSARINWEATTRKIYFDELPRITRSHREFLASVAHG